MKKTLFVMKTYSTNKKRSCGLMLMLLLLCCIQSNIYGQFFTEDFDDSTDDTKFIFKDGPCNDNGTDYFGIICLNGTGCGNEVSSTVQLTGGDGGSFLAAQDTNGEADCNNSASVSFTIDDIDISAQTDVYICFEIAEDDSTDGNEDWDGSDLVSFKYDIDNSGSFTKLIDFASNGTNTEPKIDSNCDGEGDGAAITSTFTTYCIPVAMTGSLMDLQISIEALTAGDEDIAVDNIQLFSGAASLPAGATTIAPCPVSCDLTLTAGTPTCVTATDAVDNYTVDIDFTGGNTGDTYTVTSDVGVISGDDPNLVATGTITISDVTEDTNINVSVTSTGGCNLPVSINAPNCIQLPAIVITEIMHSPCGDDGAEEFVEIYNNESTAVDLSNWEIRESPVGGTSLYFTFPDGTMIAPGEYIVVANSALAASLTGVTVFDKGGSSALVATQVVRVLNAAGDEVDIVSYSTTAPFPSCTNGNGGRNGGFSLSLQDVNADNNDGANYAPSLNLEGTPGMANDAGSCLSNIAVATSPTCSGDNATFVISFDVEIGTGNYELINTSDNNTVIGSITAGSMSGTGINISGTITGPTTSSMINVAIRTTGVTLSTKCNNKDILSTGINIPTCPESNVPTATAFEFVPTPPTSTSVSTPFDVTVCATDGSGNISTNYSNDITVMDNSSTATYTVSPTPSGTPTNGCVTFTVTPTSTGDINLDFGNTDFSNIQTGNISVTEQICESLYITEIMYDPSMSPEANWEFVEIFNAGTQDVDLAGAVLDDASAGTISSANIAMGIIPAGTSAVLYNNANPLADIQAAWGDQINFIAVTNWPPLNNGGDQIGLWCNLAAYGNKDFANAVTQVTYEDGSNDWPNTDNNGSVELTCVDPTMNCDLDSGLNWQLANGSNTSNPAGADNNTDNGSPGTFPNPMTQLGVSLIRFDATLKNNQVILDWTTAQEEDNARFYIERSTDGTAYETIGAVSGSGNTTLAQAYYFIDRNPRAGLNFYRLRDLDYTGKTTYSTAVAIELTQDETISVYPNPVTAQLYIAGQLDDNATYQIVNQLGEVLQIGVLTNDNNVSVANLPQGLYFINIQNGDRLFTERLIKQ